MASSIPQPPTIPVIGNLLQLDAKAPIQSIMRLAAKYGPLFRIEVFGRETLFLSSQELANEVADETRFSKLVHSALEELRGLIGDGLFTAYNDEPNWDLAHRMLMPAFGPLGLQGMFDKMLEMADQMLLRWERFGDAPIDVADTMTRLTLDTLALCAFDFRFNSFYQEGEHPFVRSMLGALGEAQTRDRRPAFISQAMVKTRHRYENDIRYMHTVADALLAARLAEPTPSTRGDLLDVMLNGVDPVTGKRLSDENIRYQLVTFLIAGHETTSGLLSFTVYLLLRNPAALARAKACVDQVLGQARPRHEHLSQLRYIEQVLMESLRLWPTAPGYAVTPNVPTTLGGVHPVEPGVELLVLLPSLHRDPAVWDEPEAFRPERFAPEHAAKLPPNAWKPFGNGRRACIGRGFAMQEAQLVLAMVLQRFDLAMVDPDYVLTIAETLTMKPKGLEIRARRRPDWQDEATIRVPTDDVVQAPVRPVRAKADAEPLLLLFGGNAGSSEAFARRLQADAEQMGHAVRISSMDDHVEDLPTEGAVLIVTSSYEGLPPDNARRFVGWLDRLAPDALAGVTFAVFGCGNRQWASTYQAVPKRVDAALAAAGARRIRERGQADASGDFLGAFESWRAGIWADLARSMGREPDAPAKPDRLSVTVQAARRHIDLQLADLQTAVIAANTELVDMTVPTARSKRHIELRLPPGMTYRAGDYLQVLPRNAADQVARALRLSRLAPDDMLAIESPGSPVPSAPVTAGEYFAGYVELAQPASRTTVALLAGLTRCPPEQAALAYLATEAGYPEVLDQRLGLFDLLERFGSVTMAIGDLLGALAPMRPRLYSIASSPRKAPDRCALTVARVDAPARSGLGRHRGVASNHLADLPVGEGVMVAVRPGPRGFRPPHPARPMIMICAGSGIAPFRGFIEERAMLADAGEAVAPSLLFFGCDAADVDFLYARELGEWAKRGLVDVRPAFSEVGDPVRFVQDRVWQDRVEICDHVRQGARLFLCGDGQWMAPGVRRALIQILQENLSIDEGRAGRLLDLAHRSGRYVSDVFA